MEVSRRIEIVNHIEKRTEQFTSKVLKAPSWVEKTNQKAINKYAKALSKACHGIEGTMQVTIDGIKGVTTVYNKLAMKAYPLSRRMAIPFDYAWLWLWKYLRNYGSNPLFVRGVHFITALQGGGKSSIMYHLMEDLRERTGKGSYVNADLEKEQLDEDARVYYKWHKYFEFGEFFGVDKIIDDDGNEKDIARQKKKFNTKYFNNLVLDEWLSQMNHRMNNTSDYKRIFIPLIASLSRMRHQKFMRVYIASQLDTTDIQLMGLFKMIHEVEIDLDIDYLQWIQDGQFKEHIKGWHVWTYQYRRNKKRGATEKTLLKKWYYKRYCDMENFETLSQARDFDGLPVDQIRTTKGVLS